MVVSEKSVLMYSRKDKLPGKKSSAAGSAVKQMASVHTAQVLEDNRMDKQLLREPRNVVQHKQERVKPIMQLKEKINVNDDKVLEKEADVMGEKALQQKAKNDLDYVLPANSVGRIVQRIPMWKKALTGIGMIGGAALMGAGALISSPALAIAGGVTLAGSAGYAAYKAYHARRRNNTWRAVRQELDQYKSVNNPRVAYRQIPAGRSQTALIRPQGAEDNDPAGVPAARRYRIDINTNNPTGLDLTDNDMIASARTHERTHIANDQRYDDNANRLVNMAPTNITNAERAAPDGPNNRTTIIETQVRNLQNTVTNDRQVPPEWRTYIHSRLDYIVQGMNPMFEFDTVVNELLHFTHAKGIEADSPTVQEITKMAKENLGRRN